MKTILTLAAAVGGFRHCIRCFAPMTPLAAIGNGNRAQTSYGPNKSNVPSRRFASGSRTARPTMADCNCAMMKMSAADCMMDMPGKHGCAVGRLRRLPGR
jgi:hypothetical protein